MVVNAASGNPGRLRFLAPDPRVREGRGEAGALELPRKKSLYVTEEVMREKGLGVCSRAP